MSDYTPIIVFAVVILIFVGIQMYNSFIKYRNQIEEEWSGIDVALKRRYNLIPNLVRAVRSYAKHELDTMESVTEKRVETGGPGHLDARQAEESKVSRALNEVLAVAEAYPDLKAST
ncbi:MAG: LemA family protein, partial [Gammaproteobacteria bacterium]